VRGGQSVGDLAPDLRDHARLQRALLVEHAGQRLARQVLHDQPRPVLVHDDVEHADHVRVLQAGPDPPLPHEPLSRLLKRVAAGRRGGLGRNEQLFDGDGPVQQLVRTAPDDAHRARADALVEPIPVPDPGGIVSRRAHRSPGYPPPLDHLSPRPVSESGLGHIVAAQPGCPQPRGPD